MEYTQCRRPPVWRAILPGGTDRPTTHAHTDQLWTQRHGQANSNQYTQYGGDPYRENLATGGDMGQHSRLISCGTAKGENKAGRGNNLCGEGPRQGCPHYTLSTPICKQRAEKYDEWSITKWKGRGGARHGLTGGTTVVLHRVRNAATGGQRSGSRA